jgi:hypothetical protein
MGWHLTAFTFERFRLSRGGGRKAAEITWIDNDRAAAAAPRCCCVYIEPFLY